VGQAEAPLGDILFYSRSHGAFAQINLEASEVQQDRESTIAFYGQSINNRLLLTGKIAVPGGSATEFIRAVTTATSFEQAAARREDNYHIVKLFYVTDRKQNDSLPLHYSSDRSPDAEMHFGTALVSIPRDHKMGE